MKICDNNIIVITSFFLQSRMIWKVDPWLVRSENEKIIFESLICRWPKLAPDSKSLLSSVSCSFYKVGKFWVENLTFFGDRFLRDVFKTSLNLWLVYHVFSWYTMFCPKQCDVREINRLFWMICFSSNLKALGWKIRDLKLPRVNHPLHT